MQADRADSGTRRFARGADQAPRRQDATAAESEYFEPVVHADFYPEEEPFKVLSQVIRNSMRTFELFEIAGLILEKPERFICVVRDPQHQQGEPARLYASVPDGLPFRSEEEALSHVFHHHIAAFLTMETVETEPPSGSYLVVHKCGITGDLISPPNYHRYQALCRQHHASKIAHVPFERFQARLESVKDEEAIKAWLEQMRHQTRYTLKPEIAGDNPVLFENLEDARMYLATKARDKLVRPAYSARFSGRDLALLPASDPIRRSVEFHLQRQRRFPLDTANHLRGRLRRLHFTVYKKGSKGISYVSAVKRRFREADQLMADNLQDLLAFLDAHPDFPARDLPVAYLGIAEGTEPAALDDAAAQRLRDLKRDLHYLISQGYVVEYSNGRLYLPPPRNAQGAHPEADAEEERTAPARSAAATHAKAKPKRPRRPRAAAAPDTDTDTDSAATEAADTDTDTDTNTDTPPTATPPTATPPTAALPAAAPPTETPATVPIISDVEEAQGPAAEASIPVRMPAAPVVQPILPVAQPVAPVDQEN